MENALVMNHKDNVAVCLVEKKADDSVKLKINNNEIKILLKEYVPFGHKFALCAIGKGENIIKYGEVIGVASCAIQQGQLVHIHNIESIRARGDRK